MAVHYGELSMTTYDTDGKHSIQRVAVPVLTAGNIVATEVATTALEAATAALSNGFPARSNLGNANVAVPFALPTDPTCSIGTKLAVTYTDTVTGKKFTTQLACADYSLGTYDSSGNLVLTSGAGATYKSAFEAIVVSDAGNAVTILRVRKVSRHFRG